jgi:hypothetical protein
MGATRASPTVFPHLEDDRVKGLILDVGGDNLVAETGQKRA